MTDLLTAAKAVIDWFDEVTPSDMPIEELRAAVERAEKQERVGFGEWFEYQDKYLTAEETWIAAKEDERERIREIIKAVGVQGNHDAWFDCCDTIMEKIDATTE